MLSLYFEKFTLSVIVTLFKKNKKYFLNKKSYLHLRHKLKK